MGRAKEEMLARDGLREHAIRLLVEVDAIQECEIHDECYTEGTGDVEEAYKLANARISSGEIELLPGMTRRNFTDMILEAYNENSSDECPYCAKNRDSD